MREIGLFGSTWAVIRMGGTVRDTRCAAEEETRKEYYNEVLQ
jgi:hypothetical protein